MMKIWIIGYGVPSEKYPINGIFSYNQAKALAQMIRICLSAILHWISVICEDGEDGEFVST